MSIGICTRYNRHEATFAALRIADWCHTNGRTVSIFTMTTRTNNVDPRWDNHVRQNGPDSLFSDWAMKHDTIVWTTVPHPAQLRWVQLKGKKTVVLLLWHELSATDRTTLGTAHVALCPTSASANLLDRWGYRNVREIPWEPGNPLFKKPEDHKVTPKVLLPLWDGNARRSEMTVIDVTARALDRCKTLELTVAYSSSTLRPRALLMWRKLQRLFPDRLTLAAGITPVNRPLLFQNFDLTLWPTHFENTNVIGLMSMLMGTPVMGFNFSPTNEILKAENSISVRCDRDVLTDMGLPKVVPDYALMDELLHQILDDPSYIRQLQRSADHHLLARREYFNNTLASVFS